MVDINSLSDTEEPCLDPLRLRGMIFHGQLAYLIPLPGQIVPPRGASTHRPRLHTAPEGIAFLALLNNLPGTVLGSYWSIA